MVGKIRKHLVQERGGNAAVYYSGPALVLLPWNELGRKVAVLQLEAQPQPDGIGLAAAETVRVFLDLWSGHDAP